MSESSRAPEASNDATAMSTVNVEELLQRCRKLEEDVARQKKINAALMDRVERNIDMQGDAFSAVQVATALESKVRERTAALQETLQMLERSNQELTRAKEAVEAGSRAKSEFLATMSHEVRTPMNGVLGMTEVLLSSELTPAQRNSADTIHRSALSLLRILNDILDFSKIEAGQMQLEDIPFNLRDDMHHALELLAPRAANKDVELIMDWPWDLPTDVTGDPGRCIQIVNNLVSNALKFTEHGEIIVRMRLDNFDKDSITYRLEVQDTGIGIKSDVLPRLFQAFTQADGSTTRKYGGTGLGLAIVQRLAALMDGKVGASSEFGRGSMFWCTLRMRKRITIEQPLQTAPLAGKSILIAVPNTSARKVLSSLTEYWGMRLIELTDSDAAIQALDQPAPIADFAIVDEQVVNSVQLLAKFVKHKPSGIRYAPSLLTSSPVLQANGDNPSIGPIFHVLNKPVRSNQVLQQLLHHVVEHAPQKIVSSNSATPATYEHIRGKNILVVEDNAFNQDVALAMLKLFGCQATVAENGLRAIELMQAENNFDLILMDCQMPEMDGFEATRRIRVMQAAGARVIPIIALTANAMAGDRERTLSAGMDDFLSKPFKRAELAEIMIRWLKPHNADSTALANSG